MESVTNLDTYENDYAEWKKQNLNKVCNIWFYFYEIL